MDTVSLGALGDWQAILVAVISPIPICNFTKYQEKTQTIGTEYLGDTDIGSGDIIINNPEIDTNKFCTQTKCVISKYYNNFRCMSKLNKA